MRVLLDNCVDGQFGSLISEHEVVHARQLGWKRLSNGELIAAAEAAGFTVMITVDKSLRHQQNLRRRTISVITLDSPRVTLPHIAPLISQVSLALNNLQAGSFVTIRSETAQAGNAP